MDIRLECHGAFFVYAALLCLTLPLPWVMAALTAAMVHELFHIIAVLLSGGTIHAVSVGVHGAVITSSILAVPQQLLCILAGPAGSLMLLLVGRYLPRLALCGLVQGLFNLLPLYPLDGGRAFRCIVGSIFRSETAELICVWTERAVIFLIIAYGFWVSFTQKLDIALILISVLLVSRVCFGKISCKEGNLGVQ